MVALIVHEQGKSPYLISMVATRRTSRQCFVLDPRVL
jgi:hypothetical protein